MAYTTIAKVEGLIGKTIPASLSATVNEWIQAVTVWINNYTKTTFEGVSADRYYDGNSRDSIIVDDFTGAAVVSLLNPDGSVLSALTEGIASDFITYPLNNSTKNEIRFTRNGAYYKFPRGNYRIKITAVWGKSTTVPADVSLAATKLVGELVNGNFGQGDLASVTLGDYSLTYNKIGVDEAAKKSMSVINILDHYRDITI